MIGMPNCAPNVPGLVMVNVPPCTSSGLSCLARARVGQVGDAAAEPEQVLLVGVLQDGDDEPPVERDGDAEVDVLLVDDVVAVERRVEDRKRAQRAGDRLGDERQERQLRAVALVRRLLLLAQLRDTREVHFEHRVDVRRGPPAEHHVLGDLLAHHAHRHDLDGLARPKRRDVLRRGLGWDCRPGRCSMNPRMSCLVTRPPMPDPAIVRDVDVVFLGDAAHQRRRTRLPGVLARFGRVRPGWQAGGWRSDRLTGWTGLIGLIRCAGFAEAAGEGGTATSRCRRWSRRRC